MSSTGSCGRHNWHLPLGLSATTSEYEYRNKNHFLAMQKRELDLFEADRTRSPYIIFFGVTEQIFRSELTELFYSISFESYFPRDGIIIIQMESHTHATAHKELHLLLNRKLRDMGDLDLKLSQFGEPHVEGDERMKRADEGYLPKRMPKGRSRKWPTLVTEVGYSESHQKLVGDVSWWLSQSKGDVLTVLTVDINQRRKEITVEKWSSTQAGHGTSICRTVLSQEAGQNDIHATNESPLSIDFNHLFLRDTEGPSERNIEFDLNDLEYLSKQIWKLEFEEWTEDDYF